MNYIKQIIFDMRRQALVTWVTISGTALSLFLMMAMYMLNNIDTVETAPESRRSHIYYSPYIHITSLENGENNSSGSMSMSTARKLYENMPGIKTLSYTGGGNSSRDVAYGKGVTQTLETKKVDQNFWKIYDFNFISGRPFTKAENDANVRKVIITKSAAFALAGNKDLLGKEIMIDRVPYQVIGVVETVNPVMKSSYSDIYMPYVATPNEVWDTHFGSTEVVMLAEDGVKPETLKKEVERRYGLLNLELKKDDKQAVYHKAPFQYKRADWSNNDPDDDNTMQYFLNTVLLLLPAINLSGMTRARLRRRISEIGVRRAFGATRRRIIAELMTENLILTLMGGAIGLVLCVFFVLFFSQYFVDFYGFDATDRKVGIGPSFSMLFTWGAFGIAILICFVLNLLSAGIPAIKASRENPADALR